VKRIRFFKIKILIALLLTIYFTSVATSPSPNLTEEKLKLTLERLLGTKSISDLSNALKSVGAFTSRIDHPVSPIGEIKILFLRAVTQDQPDWPLSESETLNFAAKVALFWSRMSNGKMQITAYISTPHLVDKDLLVSNPKAVAKSLVINSPLYKTADILVLWHALSGAESGGSGPWSQFINTTPNNSFPYGGVAVVPAQEEGASPFGVAVHEIGHSFGLVDLYDTSAAKTSGIGNWGLMGTGNWLQNGQAPAEPSPWSKKYLGFITPVKLISETTISFGREDILEFPAKESDIEKIDSNKLAEYFMISYWQPNSYTGEITVFIEKDSNWSSNTIATSINTNGFNLKGFLVWHIDEEFFDSNHDGTLNGEDESFYMNIVNASWKHKLVDVVCADTTGGIDDLDLPFAIYVNRGDAKDLFTDNFSITPKTSPSTFSYYNEANSWVYVNYPNISISFKKVVQNNTQAPSKISARLFGKTLFIDYGTQTTATIKILNLRGETVAKNLGAAGVCALPMPTIRPGRYRIIVETNNGKLKRWLIVK